MYGDNYPANVPLNIQTFSEQLLLQCFAPACILINPEGDILNFIGKTSKYLEHAAGKANLNIYAMAREGLRYELSGAIRKAKQNYEPVILRNIKITHEGVTHYVDVTFQTTEKPDAFKGTIMIVFNDVAAIHKPVIRKSKTTIQTTTARESELETDLQQVIGELENTHEELLALREECRETNEEYQSIIEEFQSTNEELLTAKEEMQSMNEELLTVNIELQSKIIEFIAIQGDMRNLLNNIDIATLFLDKKLNIRKYTDKITEIIKLRLSDIGRPITDLDSDLDSVKISDYASEVLHTHIFKEDEFCTSDGRWYMVRIMPYRTLDDKIDGVVITFINITTFKRLETALADAHVAEKEKRASEISIAKKELLYQNEEKQNLVDELFKANKDYIIQTKENENLKAELQKTINILRGKNLYNQ